MVIFNSYVKLPEGSTICLAIFGGYIPWNLALKNKPYIWNRYLQWMGSWNGHWPNKYNRWGSHFGFPLWTLTQSLFWSPLMVMMYGAGIYTSGSDRDDAVVSFKWSYGCTLCSPGPLKVCLICGIGMESDCLDVSNVDLQHTTCHVHSGCSLKPQRKTT